jgi:hypothetical protein
MRSSWWHGFCGRWILPRTPALVNTILYEEFSLGSTVLHAGLQQDGKFWDRRRQDTLEMHARVFATEGLWMGKQVRVLQVMVRRVVETVRMKVLERMPALERGVQVVQGQLSAWPGFQMVLTAAGVYLLVSKCGGWLVRVLVTLMGDRRRVGVAGVGAYCFPGTTCVVGY